MNLSEPWIHVVLDRPGIEPEVRRCLSPDGLFCVLDGRNIRGLDELYVEIERAVPLIRGFGRNLDALIDLVRTFGWGGGGYAGKRHCLVWRRPDGFMVNSPDDFDVVLDILVGVSKELLVGEELDPTFDPTNGDDWIPTRLDIVVCPESRERVAEIASKASHLSDLWADEFRTLDVPVHVRR